MMTQCPECGSTEVIHDLVVFAGAAPTGQSIVYIALQEPAPEKKPFVWSPKTVAAGFRAAICCSCGYTQFYTKHFKEILEAHKMGCASQKSSPVVIIPQP